VSSCHQVFFDPKNAQLGGVFLTLTCTLLSGFFPT
jgi:hypothetical protein